MNKCLSNLDSRADKQRFLEANHAAFMIPKKFDAATYQNKIEEVSSCVLSASVSILARHEVTVQCKHASRFFMCFINSFLRARLFVLNSKDSNGRWFMNVISLKLKGGVELSVVPQIREEFESRYVQLHKRLTSLRAESEEVWKTLETAENSLMDMISAKDYDMTGQFVSAANDDELNTTLGGIGKYSTPSVQVPLKQPEAALLKLRADRQETEDFYLNVRLVTLANH